MKICVTGSTGFIGNKLCIELLKHGHVLNLPVRKFQASPSQKYKNLIRYNIENINSKTDWSKTLENTKCVIHCAARSHIFNDKKKDSLKIYREINVEGTRNLANQAVKAGVKRFIFLSSIKVNGEETKKNLFFKHDDCPKPEDPYGISKYEAENCLIEISKKGGLELVIIRPPLVYGEGVKGNFLTLINLVSKNIPLPLASVKNLRSFIGLDNLIDVMIKCIDKPEALGKTFVISDGQDISTPDLIKKLANHMGKKHFLIPFPIFLLKFFGTICGKSNRIDRLTNSLQIDNTYAEKVLDWKPRVNLEEGLNKTIKWFLKNT